VRLIQAILKKYFTPEVMTDGYKFSKLDTYYAPPSGPLKDTIAYINGLPLDEDPETFGLHSNANIQYEINTVKLFMDTILVIQPRVSGGKAVKSTEEIVQDMAKELLERMPKTLNKNIAHPETFATNEEGQMLSLGVFVNQEIDRFNKLLSVMKHSLSQLDKAIEGTVVMSMELEDMFNNFLNNKVPVPWEKVGYPSLKPLASWIDDLILRFDFIGSWLYNGNPKTYWIPSFFFPQGFMTAAAQTYARQTATPIDTLTFKTHIMNYYSD
jgi:dynein heavy chain